MKIRKVTKIEIVKGNRYEDDGYKAVVMESDDYLSCFGHAGVDSNGAPAISIDGRIPGVMQSTEFEAAALRVMATGTTEIVEIVKMVNKPMTAAEHAALDDHEKRVDNMMTLDGTTY